MENKQDKVKDKRIFYGFEYESIEFKIKSFLKLSPDRRLIDMFEFIEFTLQARQAYKDSRC